MAATINTPIRFDGSALIAALSVDPVVQWASQTCDRRISGRSGRATQPVRRQQPSLQGSVIGIDFGLNDDDDGGDRDNVLIWASNSTYNDTPGFGNLHLQGPASPTPTSTPVATSTPPPPTATATPVPIFDLNYSPVADTYMSAWYPNDNFGNASTLIVRSFDINTALLRFDLSDIPAGAEILQADLDLYVTARSNEHILTADFYLMRRPWVESETDLLHGQV